MGLWKTAGSLPAGPDGASPPSYWDLNELLGQENRASNPSRIHRGDPVEECFGVRFDHYNTNPAPGLVLIVTASAVAAYHDPTTVDLDALRAERTAEWDTEFAAALAIVGITPTQPEARWFVYPYYGGY